MEPYPLKLRSIFKEKIWGGRKLEEVLGKRLPAGRIGESWEVSDHGEDVSTVKNGPYEGLSLRELRERFGEELLGTLNGNGRFPLLIKFIDARDRLSIQVHPDDAYALRNESGELGKTEAWYVIWSDPGSELICGLSREISREDFLVKVRSGDIEDFLMKVVVEPGDVAFISPGTLHAIGEGILIYEVQENSDLTYRVYDWGRVGPDGRPRELHIDRACEVIDFSPRDGAKHRGIRIERGENRITHIAACRYFSTELLELRSPLEGDTGLKSFHVISAIGGRGEIRCCGSAGVTIGKGESALIPACAGVYLLDPAPSLRVLRSYVPDLLNDVVKPLLSAGMEVPEIIKLGGPGANDITKVLSGESGGGA